MNKCHETNQDTCKKMCFLKLYKNDNAYIFGNFYNSKDPGCRLSLTGSADWLEKNIGTFFIFATLKELKNLNVQFIAVSDKK